MGKQVTRKELAELVGVHERTLYKYEGEGMPVALKQGPGKPTLYDPVAVKAWLVSREHESQGGTVDLARERARKERALAQLAEQKLAVQAGELVRADEVEAAWSGHVAAIRTKILNVPAIYAARVHRATASSVGAVEAVLSEAMRDVLHELAGDESTAEADPSAAKSKRRATRQKKGRRKKKAKK